MRNGFTLIELSIVLVIVGLLIGGILVGQSLIENVRQKGIISEMEQYTIAAQQFKLRFKCIPGDCLNSDTIFGTPTVARAWGNGLVTVSEEAYDAWRNLSVTGMIPKKANTADGNYSGTSTGNIPEPGVNTPLSKAMKNHVWFFQGYSTWPGGYSSTTNNNRNQLRLAYRAAGPSATWHLPMIGDLSATDVKAIDSKIDDGLPGTGDVGHGAGPTTIYFSCSSGNDPATATYVLTQTTGCHVYFWLNI